MIAVQVLDDALENRVTSDGDGQIGERLHEVGLLGGGLGERRAGQTAQRDEACN